MILKMGMYLEIIKNMNNLNLIHLKLNEVEMEASASDWKQNIVHLSITMAEMQDSIEQPDATLTGHFTLDQLCTLIEFLSEARERLKFQF